MFNKLTPIALACFSYAIACTSKNYAQSVIFIHPDGVGLAGWQIARYALVGPDADLHWDRLPHVAIYRGHLSDQLTATSNGGAVAHATGTRLHAKTFGLDPESHLPPITASGKRQTLMQEAIHRGLRTALINSGDITEPGTAAFVAAVPSREDHDAIALQVAQSGVDIILSGGEAHLIPKGKQGRHGPGKRADGRDLIAELRKQGYTIAYTRDELLKIPSTTKKLLGIFAHTHTFNDLPLEIHQRTDTPLYKSDAPTLAEMTTKALELLRDKPFFIVVEEEGADNFGNLNNTPGYIEAIRRADDAIGVAIAHVEKHPTTLLLTTADSEAGAPDTLGFPSSAKEFAALAALGRDTNGAPYGLDLEGKPFLSAPDRNGRRHPFVVVWATRHDTSGGILVRALGHTAERIRGTLHNIDVYHVMRHALWPHQPDSHQPDSPTPTSNDPSPSPPNPDPASSTSQ